MIGSTIGPYLITAELGEGGMGVVYRAADTVLDREVALKAFDPQFTRDQSRLEQFKVEATALTRLHHSNIATLFDFFEQDGVYYLVMEYVDGQTLEEAMRQKGALPPRTAVEIFCNSLHGFEHAHERGVIHRDIKPSNLMLTWDGEVKITDFGVARVAGSGSPAKTSKLIGTLEYMSPEQVRGLKQNARSDIYSLGILLFELLTRRMPWSATDDSEIMRAHLEEPPPPARALSDDLPPEIDAVLAKALAKKPQDRFQTVGEMREALEALLPTLPAPVFFVPALTRVVDTPSAPTPVPTVALSAPPIVPPFVTPTTEGVLHGVGVPNSPPTPVVATPGAAARASKPKWLWPAVGMGGGILTLAVFGVFAALRPATVAPPEPAVMSAPALVRDDSAGRGSLENDTPAGATPGVSATRPGVVSSGRLANTQPVENDLSTVELPKNLSGIPTAPNGVANVVPTKRPTARPTSKPTLKPAAKLVAKPARRPARKPVVVRSPSPRRPRSVVARPEAASPPRRRTQRRTVRRAAPVRRTVRRSVPVRRTVRRAAPERLTAPVRRTVRRSVPRRVAREPRRKVTTRRPGAPRRSVRSGKEAALRALID